MPDHPGVGVGSGARSPEGVRVQLRAAAQVVALVLRTLDDGEDRFLGNDCLCKDHGDPRRDDRVDELVDVGESCFRLRRDSLHRVDRDSVGAGEVAEGIVRRDQCPALGRDGGESVPDHFIEFLQLLTQGRPPLADGVGDRLRDAPGDSFGDDRDRSSPQANVEPDMRVGVVGVGFTPFLEWQQQLLRELLCDGENIEFGHLFECFVDPPLECQAVEEHKVRVAQSLQVLAGGLVEVGVDPRSGQRRDFDCIAPDPGCHVGDHSGRRDHLEGAGDGAFARSLGGAATGKAEESEHDSDRQLAESDGSRHVSSRCASAAHPPRDGSATEIGLQGAIETEFQIPANARCGRGAVQGSPRADLSQSRAPRGPIF